MSAPLPEPQHQSGCGSCPTSRCCVRYDPELTGADLRRLAEGRNLDPSDFAVLTPARADQAGADAIFLADDDQAWLLRLAHQDARGPDDHDGHPCVFLVTLAPEVRRCGVYAHRPARCRTFPTEATPYGILVQNPPSMCPPGAWSMGRSDLQGAAALHAAVHTERDAWHAFLARWNSAARSRPAADSSHAERVQGFLHAAVL